ncbi:MAG: hypothetical protein AMJ62_11255 [Myxococcales bacterium SG8_38]|nr:MAG: hypothetical protein AMJ62_11255 [Myxococcales bacterium SG8_38]
MGIRAWLGVLLALTFGCDTFIGDDGNAELQRDFDGGTSSDGGLAALPDGSISDAGMSDAGAEMDASIGQDAGADTDASIGQDAGQDGGQDAGTDAGTDTCDGGPLATPIADCDPEPPPSSGNIHADCIARINQFRWECQCLPPLTRWSDGEACADGNAEYDSTNGVHASFYAQPCGMGARAQNECPGWPSTERVITGCLRAMWEEGPEDGNPNTVNGHYESMASTGYTRVACGFYTTPSGAVWGVQNFD